MLFAPTLLKTPWVQARGRAVVSLLARHAHLIRKLCGSTAVNVSRLQQSLTRIRLRLGKLSQSRRYGRVPITFALWSSAPLEWSMIGMGRALSDHGEAWAKIGHTLIDAAIIRLLGKLP